MESSKGGVEVALEEEFEQMQGLQEDGQGHVRHVLRGEVPQVCYG